MKTCKLFIDGTWLWHNIMNYNSDHSRRFDVGNLSSYLLPIISKQHNLQLQCSETILCTSIATNTDIRDIAQVEKKKRFFSVLATHYNINVELYDIDFQGRRLNKKDRSDEWSPKEKCVDIATISNLFFHASTYDICLVVTGDRDFLPAFRKLTALGKQVIVVSFSTSCSAEIATEYQCIWLETLESQIWIYPTHVSSQNIGSAPNHYIM